MGKNINYITLKVKCNLVKVNIRLITKCASMSFIVNVYVHCGKLFNDLGCAVI